MKKQSLLILVALMLMVVEGSGHRLGLMTKLRSKLKNKHRLGSKLRTKEELQMDIEDMQYSNEKSTSKILRHKKRFTKDGRACATAFAFNGFVYHDCAEGTSPDNKNTGDEWCYVDANAGGSPNWGYCKPILNYDSVRKKTQQQYMKMVIEARKVNHLIVEQIMPTSKLNGMVVYIKTKQIAVDFKINLINNQVLRVNDNYQILLKLQSQFDSLEVEIMGLKKEVEELVAKKEAEGGKDPNNCDGMLGYENEAPGDGVTGMYFDNEDFIGDPAFDRVDSAVDFQWDNEEPAPGINPDNFSVKWTTWLRVPISGKYNFFSESDDGNQVSINGKPIITHFWSQTGQEGGNWLKSHIGNLRKNMKPGIVETNAEAGLITAQSFPINLEGGTKYKLDFSMYHSVHNEEHDSGSAFSKLYWENDYMEKQIISQDFLYTENKQPPIKLFNFDAKLCKVTEMRENENAFMMNENYKLQDIPFEFQGVNGLRCEYDWPYESFKFSVNGAIHLFVIASAKSNPLPDDFKFTDNVVSLLKINPKHKPENRRIRATTSTAYNIYTKKYQEGDHVIDLTPPKEGKNHLSFFYTLDAGGSSALSCGGEEVGISNSKGADFESCSESSRYNKNGWGCANAFSGKMEDKEESMWASENQGVGAWVELKLKNAYQITRMEIKSRNSAVERNKQIQIMFDGGETRKITLKNLDSVQAFKIEPAVVSKSARFIIKQVFSSLNNGAAINLFGTPCVDPKKLDDPEKEPDEPKELIATCEETLMSNQFQSVGLSAELKLSVTCPDACQKTQGNIYGDLEYSEDSFICRAAYHSGAITASGGKFQMILKPGKFEYTGGFRSGSQSKSKQGSSILSMTFVVAATTDIMDILKQGMKIDVFDDGISDWMPGNIVTIERIDAAQAKLTVSKENMPEDSNEDLEWPDPEKLDFCGKKVNKRECGDSKPPAEGFNVKIAFGLKGAPQGYILDSGEKKQEQNGFDYGWSMENSKSIRVREEGEGLENQLVLFSPDSASNYCTDTTLGVTCEDNVWSIKAPRGMYNVKLVMGDKKYQTQYDLSVNGVNFVKGKFLKKDQFFSETKQIKVPSAKPVIKISTKCAAEKCDYSWSRISAIEIEKVDEPPPEKEVEDKPALGCGVAFEGGKCSKANQNYENCLFKTNDPWASYCEGVLYLVDVASDYICKDQIGKYKCCKAKFDDAEECEKKCPAKCKGVKCEAIPVKAK